jgi:ligand-binding SRPBCC domain-containing protein
LIGADLPAVFRFFKDPRNLEPITPPWLRFRVLEASDREVAQGTRICYRLRLHGIPLRWESLIAEYEENVQFADAMVAGPYRSWYHRHRFRAVPEGVQMEDVVDYALPWGPLGRLAHAVAVRRQLEAIFAYRRRRISYVFNPKEVAA